MTYRIMKTKYCILQYDIKFFWGGGGGGQVIFPMGSLDLNFVRRGVIQNLDDGSKFQPAP